MSQIEFFGFGSIDNLNKILKIEKPKKVFLVTGKDSFEKCGAKKEINKILTYAKCKFNYFSDFSPNPKLQEIQRGYKQFRESNYELIIGVGGGSSIDVSKAIKMFYFQDVQKKIPLIAIPTTNGSGSEATYFIVYYKGKKKQSKGNQKITLPDYVICDSQFSMFLPKKIAASTGMDALSQAVESYWSINSNEESKKIAEKSIKLSINNLEKSVNNPSRKTRENMMKAANLAGKVINITKTTACHSISYPLTSYFNISHGHAVGLTLAEILVYNSQVSSANCLDKRGVNYVKKTINDLTILIGKNNPYEAKNKIQELMQNIGLETKLSQLGLKKEDINIIIKNVFKSERIKNNPRDLKKKNIKEILESIMYLE